MGWSIGYDSNYERDIGYGVPALCDHPECNEEIDRGLSYVCGGDPGGGEKGCGLFFCSAHLYLSIGFPQLCERCTGESQPAFDPKPDIKKWRDHKRTDESWSDWRKKNPKAAAKL